MDSQKKLGLASAGTGGIGYAASDSEATPPPPPRNKHTQK